MNDLFAPSTRKCPTCGKQFSFACREDEWGYGYGTLLMCSYHCMRDYERKLGGYKTSPRNDSCENRSERDARVVQLFREGVSKYKISQIMGIADGTVRNILHRYGVNGRELRAERNEQIRKLRAEGKTIREISDIVGISESAIDKVLYAKKRVTA